MTIIVSLRGLARDKQLFACVILFWNVKKSKQEANQGLNFVWVCVWKREKEKVKRKEALKVINTCILYGLSNMKFSQYCVKLPHDAQEWQLRSLCTSCGKISWTQLTQQSKVMSLTGRTSSSHVCLTRLGRHENVDSRYRWSGFSLVFAVS